MQTFVPGLVMNQRGLTGQVFRRQLKDAERLLAQARETKRSLSSASDVEALADRQRHYMLDAIGQLPDERCDLNARTTGRVDRDGFSVERVLFESLPAYPVSANLYVPKGVPGKVPAVLLASGHGREAKAFYQSLAKLLAKNGVGVLAVDPVGQGERMQLIDRTTGAQICQWGTLEHSYVGLICTALGQSILRYFVWDLMRALDVLESRDEFDSERFGCAGNSGGGTQTSHMMLLDDRLAAAAPSCYLTERLAYMKEFDPHDAEQNCFGHIPAGFNYDDFVTAFAPKPVLMAGTTSDFFPVEGFMETYEIASHAYSLFGAEANCRMALDDSTHGLTFNNQCAMVRFFAEVFAGRSPEDLDLTPEPAIAESDLLCTRSGQVLMDFPAAKSLPERIADSIPAQRSLSGRPLLEHVRQLVLRDRQPRPLYPKCTVPATDPLNRSVQRLCFTSEEGILIPGILIRPAFGKKPYGVTIVVGNDITQELATKDPEPMIRLRDRWSSGDALLFLDPRASGAVPPKPQPASPDPGALHGTLFTLAYNAWMLGDDLVCQRAYDILRAVEMLRSKEDVDPQSIAIHGEGDMAFPALLAAVCDQNVQPAGFPSLPTSFGDAFRSVYYDRRAINERTVIYGMLPLFDIPELLDLLPAD